MRDRAISVTRTPVMAAVLGLALTVEAVVVAVAGAAAGDKAVAGFIHGLLVAAPAAVGVAVLARRPGDRFARLLLATAVLWSLTALQQASGATAYSVGRLAVWVGEAAAVYLLLAFPSGSLTTRFERAVWRATALLVGLLYVPTALVVQHFPEPSAGQPCHQGC